MGTRVIAAMVVATAASACAEPAGALDPDVVHDLSRTPGDAAGSDHSGVYEGQLIIESCGCPNLGTLDGFSVCRGVAPFATMEGDRVFAAVYVVHTDGILLVEVDGIALTGGIDGDGTFSVGALFDMTTLVTSGDIVTRLDGDFDPADNFRAFEGRLQTRLHGDAAAPGLDELGQRTRFDCVETLMLEARRVP